MRPRMRIRRTITALAAAAALAGAAPALTTASHQGGVVVHMYCVAPTDAAGLDAILADAGSPLAGEGAAFVEQGRRIGVDPRALVAIAAHETMLETYEPAQRIRNPFGLGPGWSFDTHADAIARAATALDELYLPEGRIRIPDIGAKWAPIGAANDPNGLNQHWTTGVSTYYRALGGDPDRPVLIDTQVAQPACAGAVVPPADDTATTPAADDTATSTEADAPAADGPPVITAWGGITPTVAGSGPEHGADAATGRAATIPGFVFPLALAPGARAEYGDTFSLPGSVQCSADLRLRCAVTITADAGAPAVAMAGGVLEPATVEEMEEGIGLWLVTSGGDRLGYGALASYAPGVQAGATVRAGQLLGTAPTVLRVAWERGEARTNPYPLLAVTRAPSDAAG